MFIWGVWNQLNGMVEWTTGMEYWNGLEQDLNLSLHIIYSIIWIRLVGNN